MSEIKLYNMGFNYYPGAGDECERALSCLGYTSFCLIRHTGSHHADIYFFDDDEEKFKKELLGNTVVGQYRKFYFSYSYSAFGYKNKYYSVGYSSKT